MTNTKPLTRDELIREMESNATECIREATAWQNAVNALKGNSDKPFLVAARKTVTATGYMQGVGRPKGKGTRTMSAAARKRIADAQRARWAKWKRNNKRAA